ncbi:hypothetical protein ACUSIJ_11130 [Pseudochelatococcus sp. B33]
MTVCCRASALPVSVLYPTSRQLSPRLRLFIDWAIGQFTAREAISDPPLAHWLTPKPA